MSKYLWLLFKWSLLNDLYKVQLENSNKQSELNSAVIENSERLKEQMESLAQNLSSLNGVYGGMLSAMSNIIISYQIIKTNLNN